MPSGALAILRLLRRMLGTDRGVGQAVVPGAEGQSDPCQWWWRLFLAPVCRCI